MSRKKIIIGAIALVIVVVAIYAWSEFTRMVRPLTDVEPDFTTDAVALIAEFEANETEADKKYHNKIIVVNGMVKSVDELENTFSIALGDTNNMSSVRCVLDSNLVSAAAGIRRGQVIAIKGAITGFKKDDTGLLGSDVELNRCVIE
jgi:OB-fold nucleic acid binding domain.